MSTRSSENQPWRDRVLYVVVDEVLAGWLKESDWFRSANSDLGSESTESALNDNDDDDCSQEGECPTAMKEMWMKTTESIRVWKRA